MKISFNHILLGLLCVAMLTKCAQPGMPSGGAKDEEPPKVVQSNPENKTLNFQEKIIEIEFDEYIRLNDVYNQILVSPPLTTRPVIELKRKTLTIEFQEELRENTTYSLNFGEAIKDNNEGNILRNFNLAFSTGNELDSLKIGGICLEAKSGIPAENAKVMLYNALEDSLPLTTKPYYLAQSDENGRFQIDYLPEGVYKAFALKESNGNFIYDDTDEEIAFLADSLNISPENDSLDSLVFRMFNENLDFGYVNNLKFDSLGFGIVDFSKTQNWVKVHQRVGESIYEPLQYLSETRDSLFFFTTEQTDLIVERKDTVFSVGETEYDTLQLKFHPLEDVSAFTKNLKIYKTSKHGISDSAPLKFRTNRPISDLIQAPVILDSDSNIVSGMYFGEKGIDSFVVGGDFKSDESHTGYFLPNSVLFEHYSNADTVNFKFKTVPEEYFGELILIVGLEVEYPVLFILDKKKNVIKKTRLDESKSVTYTDLEPGSYEIVLIEDTNNDSEWTMGNYSLKATPERVYVFPQTIEIRSNWSQSFEWR